tara:strand:+ start:1993 stop:2289 length:297 start_codon:yes stop_codon:yes gene_type:complete
MVIYMGFFDLPLEIRNKILYKSGFKTPCAEAMTYIINENNEYRKQRWDFIKNNWDIDTSFVKSLTDLNVLNHIDNDYISLDTVIELIMFLHTDYYELE